MKWMNEMRFALRHGTLLFLLLLLLPAKAQRVVVICLAPAEAPALAARTASLSGAQALLVSHIPSSPLRRATPLSAERWERSVYLSLNAGTRTLAPANGAGYPATAGLLPETSRAQGVSFLLLTSSANSPTLLVGAPHPERVTQVVPDREALIREAREALGKHTRLLLWVDLREGSWEQVERAVQELTALLEFPRDALYLLAPIPSASEAQRGCRLGWVLRLGAERAGLLTTSSTRLPGLVTLPDLTATWIRHFASDEVASRAAGSPAEVIFVPAPARATERLYRSLMRQAWWRERVGTLPTVQLAALLLGWLVWYRFGWIARPLWLFPCVLPLLGVSVVPLLVSLPLGELSLEMRVGVWAVCLVALLGVLSRFPLCQSLRALATLLLVFVAVGLLHGGTLLRWSGFGYVLQNGARFYGIGNEIAGSVMGAQSLFLLGESAGRSLVRWLLTALAFGAPSLGANVGATLSALSVTLTQAARFPHMRRWGTAAVAALIAGILWWEATSPAPTHLGRFLQSPHTWLPIVGSKLSQNLAVLRTGIWTPLLVLGLVGLRGAPLPVWSGALALLLFNDLGAVAASTMLVWWWAGRAAQWEADKVS